MVYEFISRIIIALIKIFFQAAVPVILKGAAPKDLTKEQKDKIARGEKPNLAGQGSGKFNHHKD